MQNYLALSGSQYIMVDKTVVKGNEDYKERVLEGIDAIIQKWG